MKAEGTWFSEQYKDSKGFSVAYFSPEFGIDTTLPIYAGGLGILAGDHLKSASDLGIPLIAVGLLYRQGYFISLLMKMEYSMQPMKNILLKICLLRL